MDRNSEKIVSFTIIYNKFKRKVYNYTLRMVSDKNLCEDIVQNVFMKLFENLDSIRNKNGINSWIFTTTRNEIYGFFREKKIKTDRHGKDNLENISQPSKLDLLSSYDMKELKELILSELDQMPAEQKEVYLLKEYGGLSYKEIAGILGIEVSLVKSRLYKVRQKLINQIGNLIL